MSSSCSINPLIQLNLPLKFGKVLTSFLLIFTSSIPTTTINQENQESLALVPIIPKIKNSCRNSISLFFDSLSRTGALGLPLAAFSVVVPFLGKLLKGASSVDQAIFPEGSEQLFLMSQNISDTIK